MATIRGVLTDAMRTVRALGPGEQPTAAELALGLETAQALIAELHRARGPLLERDAATDLIAGEDQRVRVAAGSTITVTLPNAVRVGPGRRATDFGFAGAGLESAPDGSDGQADGAAWRAPSDGARIEVVGADGGLWFYRADLNRWMPARDLNFDSELPLSEGLSGAFAALLAERLIDVMTTAAGLTPALSRRLARARAALFTQPARRRAPVTGDPF